MGIVTKTICIRELKTRPELHLFMTDGEKHDFGFLFSSAARLTKVTAVLSFVFLWLSVAIQELLYKWNVHHQREKKTCPCIDITSSTEFLQFCDYLQRNGLFVEFHSGLRIHRKAQEHVTNDMLTASDNRLESVLFLQAICAAYNTVDHNISVQKPLILRKVVFQYGETVYDCF